MNKSTSNFDRFTPDYKIKIFKWLAFTIFIIGFLTLKLWSRIDNSAVIFLTFVWLCSLPVGIVLHIIDRKKQKNIITQKKTQQTYVSPKPTIDSIKLYEKQWKGKDDSGIDSIILKNVSGKCAITYSTKHFNHCSNSPQNNINTAECILEFDELFDWFYSELIEYINNEFGLCITVQECIKDTEYRNFVLANTGRQPAFSHPILNSDDPDCKALNEFNSKTKVLVVLESQYGERVHTINIDKNTNIPYEVYEEVVGMSGPSYASCTVSKFRCSPKPITYDEVLALIKKYEPDLYLLYEGINEANWKNYDWKTIMDFWLKIPEESKPITRKFLLTDTNFQNIINPKKS